MNNRIVALLDGGDWSDASVEHLVVPKDMDLEHEKEQRDKYHQEVYLPAYKRGEHPEYKSLSDWLIERGARKTTEEEVEEFWDW